jgi:hypothetical protein
MNDYCFNKFCFMLQFISFFDMSGRKQEYLQWFVWPQGNCSVKIFRELVSSCIDLIHSKIQGLRTRGGRPSSRNAAKMPAENTFTSSKIERGRN